VLSEVRVMTCPSFYLAKIYDGGGRRVCELGHIEVDKSRPVREDAPPRPAHGGHGWAALMPY